MRDESEIEVNTTRESEQTAEPTAEPTPADLAGAEAQTVIQAVEPILKKVKNEKN